MGSLYDSLTCEHYEVEILGREGQYKLAQQGQVLLQAGRGEGGQAPFAGTLEERDSSDSQSSNSLY